MLWKVIITPDKSSKSNYELLIEAMSTQLDSMYESSYHSKLPKIQNGEWTLVTSKGRRTKKISSQRDV